MFDQDIITIAMEVATRAHNGQIRKYTREPYVVHPFAVAGLVRSVTDDEYMIAAALLHDVIEDTEVNSMTIWGLFGPTVGMLVDGLTDVSTPEDGNRAVRKALDREHLANQPPAVKTIKLADLIDNTKSIVAHDENFAKVYMHEKDELLHVLKEGDQTLWSLARETVDKYFEQKEDV